MRKDGDVHGQRKRVPILADRAIAYVRVLAYWKKSKEGILTSFNEPKYTDYWCEANEHPENHERKHYGPIVVIHGAHSEEEESGCCCGRGPSKAPHYQRRSEYAEAVVSAGSCMNHPDAVNQSRRTGKKVSMKVIDA